MAIRDLDERTFPEFVRGENVLVDFSAVWCAPCRFQEPILDELAKEADGRFAIGKLDIDESPRVADEHGIMGVPTLVVFRNGSEARRFVGVTTKDALLAALDEPRA